MARLPIPGSDDGSWGDILNAYLLQSLTADGSIKTGVVGSPQLADTAVTSAKLAPNAVTSSHLSAGSVTNSAITDGAIAQSKIANLSGDLAGKADTTHSHTLTDVTDAGTAASLNVGTIAGTVAAGDDSRLTGALQASGLDAATAALVGNSASATGSSLMSTFAPALAGRPGGSVVFLGDSITAGADDNTYEAAGVSWPTLAALYSGQRLRRTRNAGVPGNTTAAMLARFDTDVTPYDPATVTLLCGTNDHSTMSTTAAFTAWTETVEAIIAKIRGIGAVPVMATVPPINTASRKPWVARMNAWINAYAAARGIAVLDFYTLLADPTNSDYKSGYYNDGVHPNAAGYVAMGSYAATALAGLLPFGGPPLCADDIDRANIVTKGCFTAGTGSSLPTNWANGSGTPAGSTVSYVVDSYVPGQMLQIAQVATTLRVVQFSLYIGSTTLTNSVSAGGTSLVIPDRADFGGVLFIGSGATAEAAKIASSSGAGPQTETLATGLLFDHAAGETIIKSAIPGDELIFTGVVTSDGGVPVTVDTTCTGAAYSPAALKTVTAAVTRGVWYQRFTVPAGTTQITFRLHAGAGTGTVAFGRVGVYNATRLGI